MTAIVRRRVPRSAAVWTFELVLVAITAVFWRHLLGVGRFLPPQGEVSWLYIAAGLAATDLFEVHFEFRRQTYMITLGEVPLLTGIVFCTPLQLLVARLVSAVITNVWRQSPVKAAFNVALFSLHAAVATALYRVALHAASPVSPRGWLAALTAIGSADLLAAVAVLSVIGLSGGRLDRRGVTTVVQATVVVVAVNLSLGLVALAVLWVDVRAAWTLLLPFAVFALGYRAHRTLRRRYANLELLHRYTQRLTAALSTDDVVESMLAEARRLLRADLAELSVTVPGGVQHCVLRGDEPLRIDVVASCALCDGVRRSGQAVLIPAGGPAGPVRSALKQRELRDAMIAPLDVDGDGVLLVADRLGDVSTFDHDDLLLFETLVGAAGMALRNGQLLEQLRAEAAAKHHQALHDALTGLPNRSLFAARVAEAVGRRTDGRVVAVLLMDLDEFKEVNDTLGHHTGDTLLREAGSRLAGALGSRGTVARLGGDEFAIVVPDAVDADDAVAVAAELRASLERPIVVDDITLEVRTSIGVAVAPDHGDDASSLLQRADVAMYGAKAARTGVQLYVAEHDHYSPRRLGLVSELRTAIETHALDVYFQPIAEVATGTVRAAEALVRWIHPVHGFVPPDEFIPIAEQSGLIRPLTRLVLAGALGRLAMWRALGRDLSVSVNLSARSLLDTEIVDDVRHLLQANAVEARCLTLELTESTVMGDIGRSVSVLDELADLGVRLSIDDFGTGYSSLARLRRMPVDEIKIDRSFVFAMVHDADDAAIVRSTVDLARNLGLSVVAEGVEDVETWRQLLALGCDAAQGYLLSRPLPANQFLAWLTDEHPHHEVVTRSLS